MPLGIGVLFMTCQVVYRHSEWHGSTAFLARNIFDFHGSCILCVVNVCWEPILVALSQDPVVGLWLKLAVHLYSCLVGMEVVACIALCITLEWNVSNKGTVCCHTCTSAWALCMCVCLPWFERKRFDPCSLTYMCTGYTYFILYTYFYPIHIYVYRIKSSLCISLLVFPSGLSLFFTISFCFLTLSKCCYL